jgi:D-sedoheptulose 7-phosphate isomerase
MIDERGIANPNRADAPAEMRRIANDSLTAHQAFIEDGFTVLADVAEAFVRSFKAGNKILLFGNGGSAADAQHVAGELVGRFLRESEPWPALALTTDSSILTCIGNDWDFSDVFARQVRAHARPGDIVVGITTSGASPNVIRGLQDARRLGATTIGFTGTKGASLREHADICYCAPVLDTPRVQELHLLAWHIICEIVESEMIA